MYPTDHSISLDTMALSYLEPFLQRRLAKLPADFFEVFEFISRPAVNVDPLPYMQENHWNVLDAEKKARVFEKLRAYEVLRRIDRSLLEAESRVRPLVSDYEIELGARKLLNSMLSKHEDDANGRTYTDTLRHRHLAFYCVLMKMVEIKLRGKGHLNKMTDDFFSFLHTEMQAIYMREAVIARAYFENGTDLQFFRKIQVNKASIFGELKNMAWDLLHIRHVEQGFVLKPDDRARYYFPAFLTFDYRLTELVDLCPLKAVALSPSNQILPFYFGDALFRVAGGEPDFKDALAEEYFSLKAVEERAQRRPDGMSFVEALTLSLETQLASAANVAAPAGSHSQF